MLNQKALVKRFSFVVYLNLWANTYQKNYVSLRVYFSRVRSSWWLVWLHFCSDFHGRHFSVVIDVVVFLRLYCLAAKNTDFCVDFGNEEKLQQYTIMKKCLISESHKNFPLVFVRRWCCTILSSFCKLTMKIHYSQFIKDIERKKTFFLFWYHYSLRIVISKELLRNTKWNHFHRQRIKQKIW